MEVYVHITEIYDFAPFEVTVTDGAQLHLLLLTLLLSYSIYIYIYIYINIATVLSR